MNLKTVAVLLSGALCAGCLEDEGRVKPQEETGPVVLRARMTAPVVSGMNFRSGGQVGVTDADGYFTYELGEPIQLAVAGVDLGIFNVRPRGSSPVLSSVPPATSGLQLSDLPLVDLKVAPLAITPANLSFDPTVVANIERLLLMADSDGNSGNGVNISGALQRSQPRAVDLASVDFESAAEDVRTAAIAADGGAHRWPSAHEAMAYLEARRTCSLTGLYRGSMSATSVAANISVIALPPFAEVSGIIKTAFGDPYTNGLFHFSLNPTAQSVGNTVGADLDAILHYQGYEWPTAGVIAGAPSFNLLFDWVGQQISGGWRLNGADGTFDANLLANLDSSGTEFATVHRFIRFPVRWTHAQGHSMYDILVVEINRSGDVSARLLEPIPSVLDANLVSMQGSVSSDSRIVASARNTISGGESWRFEAVFDQDAMTLRAARLYQSSVGGMVTADDFGGEPILGCSL